MSQTQINNALENPQYINFQTQRTQPVNGI